MKCNSLLLASYQNGRQCLNFELLAGSVLLIVQVFTILHLFWTICVDFTLCFGMVLSIHALFFQFFSLFAGCIHRTCSTFLCLNMQLDEMCQ